MKTCPYCAEQIQSDAVKCRYCGEWLDDRGRAARIPGLAAGPFAGGLPGYYWGYEYRSPAELLGWPLLHIAQGYDPQTGRPRVARGWIAIGNIAIGGLALGGIAVGGVAFGGLGLGVLAIGGLAVGAFALGGLALAAIFAAGGMAASLLYALGGAAIAPHAISGLGVDPEFVRLLQRLFPGFGDLPPDIGR